MFLKHVAIVAAMVVTMSAQAGELPREATNAAIPDDIWSGRHGGFPSFGASVVNGVSVELPAKAFAEAGGGSLAQFAKHFLDRYGPHMCSDAFDFQSPHKHLRVQVALIKEIPFGAGEEAGIFYIPDGYQDVFIDYNPTDKVHCVRPSDLES